ncbi:MAG: hypothetical protein LBQ77_05655 [Treponema sp.]|jgi:hypothetical protein|nr:hypothetical protein [Treponema sp.]
MKKNHGIFFGFAVLLIAAMITVTGCNEESTDSDPTPNTDPKALAITNLNTNNFTDTNLQGLKTHLLSEDFAGTYAMLGIFTAGTTEEEAFGIFQALGEIGETEEAEEVDLTKLVAGGSSYDVTTVPQTNGITPGTTYTATFELSDASDVTVTEDFEDSEDPAESEEPAAWTGYGTYDIYIAIIWYDSENHTLVYKKEGVAFNAATTSVDATTFTSVELTPAP